MNPSSNSPTAMRDHHGLSEPWNVMAVWMMPKMMTPKNVPITDPDPPLSSVPPTTTAAIASSSSPLAAVALPDDVYTVNTMPASAEQNPLSAYTTTFVVPTGRPISAADCSLPPSA